MNQLQWTLKLHFAMFLILGQSLYGQKTFHLEEFCSKRASMGEVPVTSGSIKVGYPLNSNSSGYLRTAIGHYNEGLNCSIYLAVPRNVTGIAVSFREVKLTINDTLTVRDDKGKTISLRRYLEDNDETFSFISQGNMTITFKVAKPSHSPFLPNATYAATRFQLTFTSFNNDLLCSGESFFQCGNRHCIWKGLMCNGHNNCGDRSDEESPECDLNVNALIVGLIFGCILLIVFIVSVVLYQRRSKFIVTRVVSSQATSTVRSYPAPEPYSITASTSVVQSSLDPKDEVPMSFENPNYR